MLYIKRNLLCILYLSAFLSISKISFAASEGGFEAIVNIPLGTALTVVHKNVPVEGNPKGHANFQCGIETDIGYMFQLKENMGISLLGVFGYNYTSASYSKYNGNIKYKFIENDIYIGILPKFNINSFSIGINLGCRFTLSPNIFFYNSKDTVEIKQDIYPRMYIRGTFDYSIFFREDMAINVGIYIGYDFGDYWDGTSKELYVVKNESFGNVEVGAQFGFRFGPKF